MTRTNKTGEYIKKFNSRLTGRFNYKERVQKANGVSYFRVQEANYHPSALKML